MRGGGAEKVIMLIGNELIKLRWDVTFIMTKSEGPYLSQLDHNIEIIELPFNKISMNIFALRKIFKMNSYDILFASMNHVNIISCISHKLSNSPSVLILSEHSNIKEVIDRSGFILAQGIKLGVKYFYNYSDHIVCVSKKVKSSLASLMNKDDKISVINNPIEQYGYSKKHEIKKAPFYILSIGRLTKVKNYPLLLKSFRHVIDHYKIPAELHILGDGEERNNLESLVTELKLSDIVFFHGFKNPEKYLNKADLFVLTSNTEGFGNVIVEALSVGLPVISTNCPGGPAEILDNGKYGVLVPVGDYMAIAEEIYREYTATSNTYIIHRRIERAQKYAPSTIVFEYINLFESLLSTKNNYAPR